MRTISGTPFQDRINASNTRLVWQLSALVMLLISALLVIVIWFDELLVDKLSRDLVQHSLLTAEDELVDFFQPAARTLRVAIDQLEEVELEEPGTAVRLREVIAPFVLEFQRINAGIVADMSGNHYFVRQEDDGGGLLERFVIGAPNRTARAEHRRYQDGELTETWTRDTEFRAIDRPWFKAAADAPPREHRWTNPYRFFTSKEPGVTVAAHWVNSGNGNAYVAAFDLTLAHFSEFIGAMRPTPNAKVFVLDGEGRLMGLPADPRFASPEHRRVSLLKTPTELHLPNVEAATRAWQERGDGLWKFDGEHEDWWAGVAQHHAPGDVTVTIGVVIPGSDLLAGIATQRNMAIGAVVIGAVLTAAMLVMASVRRMRSLMKTEVDRIERDLGQYHLMYRVGSGGNGTVYRARHAMLRRPTAIKIMKPEFARDEKALARFEQEAQITSGLTHPNTVAIFDFGRTPEGAPYYAMEFLTGFSLDELVRNIGPVEPGRVMAILEQVCGSLAEAHGQGLIHRDIKPANIMLCERGGVFDVAKVLDFGLVKSQAPDDPEATHVGLLVGTPQFMAPELINGEQGAGPMSDLYALGATAYFLLCGEQVFGGTSNVEICAQHLTETPVPPSRRVATAIPTDLEALVLQCLEKDASRRPQSAAALAEALTACAGYGSWTRAQAARWWSDHQIGAPNETRHMMHTPLSDTQLLVDIDERLGYLDRPQRARP